MVIHACLQKKQKLYKLYTASKYKELFLSTIIHINVNNSSNFYHVLATF